MQNDDVAASHDPNVVTTRRERKIVILLCALATIRVFIFSAAFPFFNNVDEPIHFDLVLRYANGEVPRQPERILTDSVEYIAFYNSWGYYATPEEFPSGKLPPPLWTEPPEKKRHDFEANCARWQLLENYEVSQTPLYYSIAGAWWDIGKSIGIRNGHRLYWLRFFNVIEVITLVWLVYIAARMVFPDKPFIRLGTPALLAFMPQTALYSIGNDVLPATCFAVTFLCLLKWLSAEKVSLQLAIATGLAFATTWLAKETTLPVLAVATAVLVFQTWKLARDGKGATLLVPIVAFVGFAALPILGWMMWRKFQFGDFTGSRLKMEHLGWTLKPFAEWWHHPIFTPAGIWTYLSGQLSTFWQGEFIWHNQRLVLPGSAAAYTILSLFLIFASLLAIFPRFSNASPSQSRVILICLLCFAASLGFFALLSIIYDFHDCPYPSRHYPYFTSGRLLLGSLVPFLILVIYGLDRLLDRFGTASKFIALGTVILAMFLLEIVTDWSVFFDPYNWYHLP